MMPREQVQRKQCHVRWLCLLAAQLLIVSANAQTDSFTRTDIITDPVPAHFSVCSEHTCKKLSIVGLAPSQWQQIRAIFSPEAVDAVQERASIASAIALMETIVGELTGTSHDKGRNFQGVGTDGQMDCIDESTNTSLYLTMMVKDGLLKWHTVEDHATRGWFFFGWPHSTAVIRDTSSGELFAVDSWFEDNGEPPHILPLSVWRDGWNPPEHK